MPPIRQGDGTVLNPKGFAEVRKGDGTVLWSATPAILDSATFHYPFLERSGSTIDEEIAGEDATANGTTNVSDEWWEGHAEESDGTGHIEATTWNDFGSNLDGDMTLFFTFKTTDPGFLFSVINSGGNENMAFEVGMTNNWDWGDAYGDTYAEGYIGFNIRDDDPTGDEGLSVVTDSAGFDDGDRYRVAIRKSGNNGSDLDIFINGQEESVSVARDGLNTSGLVDFDEPVVFLARNIRGSIEDERDGTMDNVIVTGGAESDISIQDDYASQPWINSEFSVTSGNESELYDAMDNVSPGGSVYVEGDYDIDDPLLIKDGVTLESSGATYTKINDTIPAMLHNAEDGETISNYDAAGNFTIDGGTWDANFERSAIFTIGCCENATFKNVTFQNVEHSHFIEGAALKDAEILNCEFTDLENNRGAGSWTEMIQLEPANNQNTTWESTGDTPTDGVLIEGCTFEETVNTGDPVAGVGDHSDNQGVTTDNIDIIDNEFIDLEAGVRPVDFDTVLIEDNTFTDCDEDVTNDGTNVTENNNTSN